LSIDIREFCLRTRYNPFHLNKYLYVADFGSASSKWLFYSYTEIF